MKATKPQLLINRVQPAAFAWLNVVFCFVFSLVLSDPTPESGHHINRIYKYCIHQLQNPGAHLKRKIKHINYYNELIVKFLYSQYPEYLKDLSLNPGTIWRRMDHKKHPHIMGIFQNIIWHVDPSSRWLKASLHYRKQNFLVCILHFVSLYLL